MQECSITMKEDWQKHQRASGSCSTHHSPPFWLVRSYNDSYGWLQYPAQAPVLYAKQDKVSLVLTLY